MSDDPFESPDFKRWAKRAVDELAPMIKDSAITVSIVPRGETDVKFAVELGFSIMLGKPIILAVSPGTQVPAKLAQIADAIVEFDLPDETASSRLQAAIGKILGPDS